MLRIENLTKKYGDKTAVDDLSLTIRSGGICGFIGHNGAGKTTTIKCVAGILSFDSGRISVDDISVSEKPLEVKRNIAYIPDDPTIYPFMTGENYLNFISDVFRIGEKERNEKIIRFSDMFEITNDLAKPVSQYSHGMKQKLALIGGFIHEPKLLLLDEPFVGLDPKAAKTVKELMRDLCDAGGEVFFSTHVLEVAEKLCDEVAIIRNGKLIASGDTEKVCGNESLEDVFLELTENAGEEI